MITAGDQVNVYYHYKQKFEQLDAEHERLKAENDRVKADSAVLIDYNERLRRENARLAKNSAAQLKPMSLHHSLVIPPGAKVTIEYPSDNA